MPSISSAARSLLLAAIAAGLLLAADTVRVSPRDPRYLELSNGKPYLPVGLNMIGARDFATFEGWMRSLAANRGNYIRVWLSNPLWAVEHERSGVYDEAKAKQIDAMLELCDRLGIRVKLTMEHFRSIGGGRQAWADQPLHNVANGGTATSIGDFFNGETSRALFIRKIQWYKQRYGGNPAIYAWELWNEVDAVGSAGRPGGPDVLAWTETMLPELHKAFPGTLAVQSLGSFDTAEKRERYRRFSVLPSNDLAQVHRYLDLGAKLEVCHGPVDVLAAEAVRELLAFQPGKPVLLAESGGVEPSHSGPLKLYAKDKDGMLLHDILFAPFFAGAAGSGQIWHWDAYVAANNLWWHFGRFAEATKGLDPAAEHFQPAMVEHPRLRIYALRGEHTTVYWLRDAENNWMTELRDGRPPEVLRAQKMPLATGTAEIYNPWTNNWSKAKARGGQVALPEFSRSLVVVVRSSDSGRYHQKR
jgi:hypothetical protein